MSDIRKRSGNKGTTYQVRYADARSKSGYAYKTFASAKEARAFRETPKAVSVRADGKTVPEAVDEWLRICQSEGRDGRPPVSTATYTVYSYVASIMKAYPWTKRLGALGKPDVVAFRSWLIAGYSRYLSAKTLTYFHAVLAEMATRGEVATNVASGVGLRLDTRYKEAVVIPTHQEVQAILRAADNLANASNQQIAKAWQRYRPMLYLAVDSGMRPQEYVAIAGRNVSNTGVQVERALDRSGVLSVPKTPAARRFIELSRDTITMVQTYREKHSIKNEHDLIFPSEAGQCLSLDNWRKRGFLPALERAGLIDVVDVDGKSVERPRYAPYALRHYFASVLIADGENIAKIKTLMGHTDISTTFDVYAHLIQQVEDRKSKRLGLIARLQDGAVVH